MDVVRQELQAAFADQSHMIRVAVRLVIALVLGAVLGWEREQERKAAGMRTHMIVAMGSALFVLAGVSANMRSADISRIIQGIAAGLGFLGAGTILKLTDQLEIRGLTTAATIWLTAAAGTAVGLGLLWEAILSVFLTWFILSYVGRIEYWLRHGRPPKEGGKEEK